MKVAIPKIPTGRSGFHELIRIHHRLESHSASNIEIDFSTTPWFAANMCSVLEAILAGQSKRGARISIVNVPPKTEAIMRKNGFLLRYGYSRLLDTNNTSFECVRFERHQSQTFMDYVKRNFYRGGRGLPQMSDRLMSRFRESIGELFDNAKVHSESVLGIVACGQFYPRKGKLDFCITDRGIGIRENIRKHLGWNLNSLEAIKWALDGENSTRPFWDQKAGGFGLKLIREFIEKNRGRIIIVSDRGYWELRSGEQIKTDEFDLPFPGTAVTFEINTKDTQSYRLTSEIDSGDIW